MITFTITYSGGTLDMTPFIAYGGLKWQRADVDGPEAGRNLAGDMVRDRRATKIRWDVTCRPLTQTELARVLTAIADEFVTLTYSNPVTNTVTSAQFYANNFPVQLAHIMRNGVEYWTGLTFPLVEK